MAPSPWARDGFMPSHRGGTDMTFYHVYDNLSQTPYVRENIVTYHRIYEHLKWENRNSTPFISLFRDQESAIRSALFRAQNVYVFNKRTGTYSERKASSIRIAEISSQELDDCGGHYFSTRKLKQQLDLGPDQNIWKHLSDHEWFAIGHNPEEAITRDWRLRAAIRALS